MEAVPLECAVLEALAVKVSLAEADLIQFGMFPPDRECIRQKLPVPMHTRIALSARWPWSGHGVMSALRAVGIAGRQSALALTLNDVTDAWMLSSSSLQLI